MVKVAFKIFDFNVLATITRAGHGKDIDFILVKILYLGSEEQ